MRQFLGEGVRLLHACRGLVWITEHPEGMRRPGDTSHPGVWRTHGTRVMLLRCVESHALLKVCSGGSELATIEGGFPQLIMGPQKGLWVLYTLGDAKELFPQLPRRLDVRPYQMKRMKPIEGSEKLTRVSHLFTELACRGVDTFDFCGSPALDDHECRAKGDLQVQLSLCALGGVRESCEQLQALGEVTNGFHIGRTLDSPLAGSLPVAKRLSCEDCLGIVLRHQCGLGRADLWKPRL